MQVYVAMEQRAAEQQLDASAGAPAMGNTQASALQMFQVGSKCDISIRPVPACADTNSLCCHRVSANCDPVTQQFCTPTAGGQHSKAMYPSFVSQG